MVEGPWISVIGLGEDGPEGLCAASRKALEQAEVIMGSTRHLGLLPEMRAERVEWPVPFSEGIQVLAGFKGRHVTVLASGDPFWFGAGAVIARHFDRVDWQSFPALSTFSLAANHLGWSLEKTVCLGLHAAPFARLRPYLSPKTRCLVLVRHGAAVGQLCAYLNQQGFGESDVFVLESMGGPRERSTQIRACEIDGTLFEHPVCVGIDFVGAGAVIPGCNGLPDTLFKSDGVMTKRKVRALTLSALAPTAGEKLWDIGGGSGSVAIEWLLTHPACSAVTFEERADRVGLIEANARALGVDRLQVVTGSAPSVLKGVDKPDAIFIGGGLSFKMIEELEATLPAGTRVVANAVTLEAEGLLTLLHQRKGGELMRIEIAEARPLGSKTGWKAAYPIVQWSGVL